MNPLPLERVNKPRLLHPGVIGNGLGWYPWALPEDGELMSDTVMDDPELLKYDRTVSLVRSDAREAMRDIFRAMRAIGIDKSLDRRTPSADTGTAFGFAVNDDLDQLLPAGNSLHRTWLGLLRHWDTRRWLKPKPTWGGGELVDTEQILIYPLQWDARILQLLGGNPTRHFSTFRLKRYAKNEPDGTFVRKHVNAGVLPVDRLTRLLLENELSVLGHLRDTSAHGIAPAVLGSSDSYVDLMDIGDDVFCHVLDRTYEKHWRGRNKEEKKVCFSNLCRVFAQWVRCIDKAHTAGVILKDVKPANVGVETQPDGSRSVLLFDFASSELEGAYPEGLRGYRFGTTTYIDLDTEYDDGRAFKEGTKRRDLLAPVISFMYFLESLHLKKPYKEARRVLCTRHKGMDYFSSAKANETIIRRLGGPTSGIWVLVENMFNYVSKTELSELNAQSLAQYFDELPTVADTNESLYEF